MVRQRQAVAHRRNEHPGPLPPGLLDDKAGERLAVGRIEVAHRLVEQQEVERLAEAPHEGDPLLLSEREAGDRLVALRGQTGRVEQTVDLLRAAEARQVVLQRQILLNGQPAEEPQVLKQAAQRAAAQLLPRRGQERAALRPVERMRPA